MKGTARKLILTGFFLLIVVVYSLNSNVFAGEKFCRSSFINPVTDIRWEGIFPIEIAGVEIEGIGDFYDDPASEGLQTNPDKLGSIVCFCKEGNNLRFGLSVSYWEPARIVETTKIPWCFPTLGIEMSSLGKSGKHLKNASSSQYSKGYSSYTSFNVHYYFFNALDVLDLFVDMPCSLHEGFDIAYISEIDPTWNNDVLSFILNPEAILFGNPVAQLACAADSVSSLSSYPLDSLFWCIGSWGSSYPLAGASSSPNILRGSAQIAARAIYRQARMGLLWDPGVDECYAQLTPVWIKSHYKMHLIKPKKGPFIILGRSELLWESNKNPPFGTSKNSPDNFSWMVFRRVKCCLGMKIVPSSQ